ncbi:MAG: T9SS type A sorting domain-containing protein, partial [Bacteroidota bacterium]|nr:T9SS type A sorting domain-containing protein [Bacteroidota bacterium]
VLTTFAPATIVTTITPVISGGYLGLSPATQTTNGGVINQLCGNVGISETNIPQAEPVIFPNPATTFFQVSNGIDEIGFLEITDALGRVIYSEKKSGVHSVRLDIAGWERGVYFVRLNSGGQLKVKRLLLI